MAIGENREQLRQAQQQEEQKIGIRRVSNTIVEANRARRSGEQQRAGDLYDQALEGMKIYKFDKWNPISHSRKKHEMIERFVRRQRAAVRSMRQ